MQKEKAVNLVTLELSLEEFLEELYKSFDKLHPHHFINKAQSAFLRNLKENLLQNECIILLDFAENYSFIAQDAVQGYHWNNSQATLHPFVIYFKGIDNELNHISYCIISDSMQHSANAVNAFVSEIINDLKILLPTLTMCYYFSDGAASQYKNFKNLNNLCHHSSDHGIDAEWHFFATSHGKSPCDGIGGTVKRLVARTSLQNKNILTVNEMFEWCKLNITGIKFMNITESDIENHVTNTQLEERYSKAKKLPGTRSHHSFRLNNGKLEMRRISKDVFCTEIDLLGSNKTSSTERTHFNQGMYVACVYDNDWFIGNVIDNSSESEDVSIKFMKRDGINFKWPIREDQCWVPIVNVLAEVKTLIAQGHGARNYRISELEFQKISESFEVFST